MATKKELFEVRGVKLTAHEKDIYERVIALGKACSYNDLITNESEKKSVIATLARLEKTHGLLKKNEPIKVTTYEIKED